MKKIIFVITISLVFSSCFLPTVPQHVKKNFKYCYSGFYTGIDTLIKIDGFYRPKNDTIMSGDIPVGMYPNYIFDKQGFVQVDTWFKYLLKEDSLGFSGKWGDYGGYILEGDTIKLQYVDPPGGMSRSMAEVWFKIIDSKTLKKIYQGDGNDIIGGQLPLLSPYLDEYFIFTPFELKLSSGNTWIVREKWFWCDEEEFKKWKQEQKQKH